MKALLDVVNGKTKININGERFDPISYRSFRPNAETVGNVAAHGVRLMSVFPTGVTSLHGMPYSTFGPIWTGEGEYNWDNLRKQMDCFVENAPDAYLSLMLQLDTRKWFLEQNPECFDSFHYLVRSAGYEKWRKAGVRFMRDIVDYIETHYPEKIYAVFVMAGGTTEWYTKNGHYEYSEIEEKNYQAWHGDSSKTLPILEEAHSTSWGIFRHPETNKAAIEYDRYHHELIADTICYFAGKIKEHTDRRLLVGAFFGYLMDHDASLDGGDRALREVLACEDIDVLFSPAAYRDYRRLDGTSAFRVPVDSLKLHNKLYFHEIDNATHLVTEHPDAKLMLAGGHQRLENLDETKAYLKREAVLATSKGQGYWWFDMFGGWYDDEPTLSVLEAINSIPASFADADMGSVADVAIFVDQDSLYYTAGTRLSVTSATIKYQVEQLNRAGISWDAYITDDLTHPDMPHDRYKLYLFPNLFAPSRKHIEAIKTLKAQGKSMLFFYAPGVVTETGFSMEAMCDLCGIRLEEMDYKNVSDFRFHIAPGAWNPTGTMLSFGYKRPIKPMFYADDVAAESVAQFEKSGKTGLAVKTAGGRFDAWSAAGPVPAVVLRELARKAGAWIYLENAEDPVYTNKSMIACYAYASGKRVLHIPFDAELVDIANNQRYVVKEGVVEIDFGKMETRVFRILQ